MGYAKRAVAPVEGPSYTGSHCSLKAADRACSGLTAAVCADSGSAHQQAPCQAAILRVFVLLDHQSRE